MFIIFILMKKTIIFLPFISGPQKSSFVDIATQEFEVLLWESTLLFQDDWHVWFVEENDNLLTDSKGWVDDSFYKSKFSFFLPQTWFDWKCFLIDSLIELEFNSLQSITLFNSFYGRSICLMKCVLMNLQSILLNTIPL